VAGCSASPRHPEGSSRAPSSAPAPIRVTGAAIEAAGKDVAAFFGRPYPASFDVRTFRDRASLDSFVAQRWKMPPTQCWMVAMGSGPILVLLDPAAWGTQACEHDGSDPRHVRQIITHELVHVFHGQHCPQQEFDGMDDMGWFVEGLAILASGQLDTERFAQAR